MSKRTCRVGRWLQCSVAAAAVSSLIGSPSAAQQPPAPGSPPPGGPAPGPPPSGPGPGGPPQPGWQWQGGVSGYPPAAQPPIRGPRAQRKRTGTEIAFLYGTSVGYGIGLGIWLDAEIGIEDPGVRLIPPAVLGLAAPVGVFFLDQPSMPKGMPAAIAAGMAIGAGEGLGIASTQFVMADEDAAWGFKGLSRSVAIGATVGGAAGYVVGYYEEPSPNLSAFVTSGVFWGTAIGSSYGYGVSDADASYGRANDAAAVGGLIGFNVGLGVTAGLSTVFIPEWHQLGWMWAGAGIGAAVSLPVFLFYVGDDTPPAKRGLVFTGTAMLLGTVAGGVFSAIADDGGIGRSGGLDVAGSSPVVITHVVPMPVEGGAGLSVGGLIE